MSIRDLAPRWTREDVPETHEALHPISALHREMDRLFRDFFRDLDVPETELLRGDGKIVPRVDISETDTEVQVAAELPGMDEKNIEISLSDNNLTIKGEKKEEKEERKKDFYRSERRYGTFQRVFRLPEGIDEDKVAAEFDKGVLTIHLPKSAEAKSKVHKIKVSPAKEK